MNRQYENDYVKSYSTVSEENLISVIIPVYNAEQYLTKCVKSVLHQQYKKIEIILINDGSSDHSSELCEHFAEKDDRVRVIHQENSGVSHARNIGINMSRGDYCCFVDADDWLPSNAIEHLWRAVERTKADIVVGSTKVVASFRNGVMEAPVLNGMVDQNRSKWLRFNTCVFPSPWGKLFSKRIIVENQLVFPEDMKFCEDSVFLVKYLQKCRSFASICDIVYVYNRLNISSAITKYYPQYYDWVLRYLSEVKKLCDGIPDHSSDQFLVSTAKEQLYAMCNYVITHVLENDVRVKQIEYCFEQIKQYLPDIRSNAQIDTSTLSIAEKLFIALYEEKSREYILNILVSAKNQNKKNLIIELLRESIRRIKHFLYFGAGVWDNFFARII